MLSIPKKLVQTKLVWKFYSTAVPNIMESPVVTVKEGKIKGAVKWLYDRSLYYSFKGIPYAQPPVGDLRFKAPLPPKPWIDIYEATEHGPICPQINMTKMKTDKENEDCLYMNVYTKSTQSDSRMPVMVYIYGGAYMSGSGNSEVYGPEFLLQHDVVVVTFNYRVEVFGFLCLDTPEVPGNAGMKDQVAALRWVQENITQFGGDPGNVTIFGESAGGACVTYHMLSPMSSGLFHKTISQSGVCIADWAQGKDGRDRAFRLGKFLGNDTKDDKELLYFLQIVPTEALTSRVTMKTSTKDEQHRGLPIRFCPTVEKKFDGVESFLNEEPLEMILENKMNKVPTMVGYNLMEGLYFTPYQLRIIDFTNKNPQYVVPREIAEKVSEKKLIELGERIRKFYVGDRYYAADDFLSIANRETDIQISYSVHRFAHFYSKLYNSVYMYIFNYDSELNLTKKMIEYSHVKGACHADDTYYLFRHVKLVDAYEKQEKLRQLVFRITKLWTDFAKTGNPTPDSSLGTKWSPYTNVNKEYLLIDDTLSMRQYADRERVEFWDNLYSEVGLPSIIKSRL